MRLRRSPTIVVATVLLVSAIGVAPPVAAAAATRPARPADLASVPGKDFAARPAPPDRTPAMRSAPAVRWPSTASAKLTADSRTPAWSGAMPVAVSAGTGAEAPTSVDVQLIDRTVSRRSGYDLAVRLARVDGGTRAGRSRVSVRYHEFAEAFGGDWARRLRLVQLPECGLTTPDAAACRPTELATSNDVAGGVVSAEVGLASAGTLVALAAGPSSDGGDYKATDLKESGSWSAGGSAGDFTWSYPLRTPPAQGGPEPSVGLGYSAQAVDGFSAASNSQPSEIGEGFGWQPGFIDRGYKACVDDGQANVGDLCWGGDNAMLSLGGRSSRLVHDSAAGLWRPANDDGSRVERLTGPDNGDEDGEYWKVTTTDGTQYFFGLNRLPGWRAGTDPLTNSVSYVPVFGNQAGEPCNKSTFATSSCRQAYRWGLDYVIDPHGNSMSYFYDREINHYARNVTATDTPDYVRASRVREIDYGTRQDSGADTVFAGTAPDRVVFGYAYRCVTAGVTCTESNPANFPDVPLDQSCGGGNCAGKYAPTFWTTQRMTEIRTQVAGGAKTWRDVDRWRLTHEFKDPGDGNAKIMWLKQLQHCGLAGGELCLPPVQFTPVQSANRVDPAGAASSIIRYRMSSITSESGSLVTVSYYPTECVAGSNMPASPDANTKRCFPVYWMPAGASKPKLEYFHKHVVQQVSTVDLTGAAPEQVTYYNYDAPAWHSDDNPMILPARRTWGQWRGYQTVTETHGTNGTPQSRTEFRYFRGMNGDRLVGGTRTAAVPDSDGGTSPDHEWLAGQLREEITYLGTTGEVIGKTLKDPYQFGPTATQSLNQITTEARVVSTAATTVKTALDGGRGWRTTRTANTFLPDRSGRIDRVDNAGDLATTADDQCTRYTYATNAAGTLLTSLARVETVAVNCAATPNRDTDVISDVRTWYDGATSWGATVTRGLATRVERLADPGGGNPVYAVQSRTAYDANGRPTESIDALGRTTTTKYTPASGGPLTRTDVTNALHWTTVTDIDPAWGVTTRATDANDRTTQVAYDPLGRTTGVWLPGRQSPALPDTGYEYAVRNDGPTVLTTLKLNTAGTGQIRSYALYDGLLRPRQVQMPANGGGRVITETLYDSRGLEAKRRPPYFNAGSPSPQLFVPTGDTAVPAQTVLTYDGAERLDAETFQVDAVAKWRTRTTYGGDHTTTEAPAGGTASAEWTDARGQVVKSWQYHGNLPTGAYDETVRTYTKAGDLASVRDGSGTTWRYAYDQRRRQIRDEDPDKGAVTYTYDDGDQMRTMTDARGVTMAFGYDSLGRRTTARLGSADGRLLTSWKFDTLAKGQLTSSIRLDEAGNQYVSEVTQYTPRYQPLGTKTTIPAGEGALAGEYTTAQTYNPDGSVATRTLPAKTGAANFGGLTAETITFGYTPLGLPDTVTGLSTYVTQTEYRHDGKVAAVHSSGGPDKDVVQYMTYEHGTGRLAEHQVLADFAPVVAADTFYDYDAAGNITSIADKLSPYGAGKDDTQCFRYDGLRRLSTAWTPADGDCAADPAAATTGGPAPYLRSYTYAANGNRLSETEQRTTGNTTKTLTYPATNSDQPHAVTKLSTAGPGGTTTDSYSYDAAGNTVRRPGATDDQTLTWNPEGKLASVTEKGATTTFLYDPEGGRLIQRDPGGRTLYVGGVQYRATTGGAVTATRLYQHDLVGTVASRDTTSGLSWQATDHQGSAEIAFRAMDMTLTQRRFAPFGLERGTSPAWSNPFGYVGGEQDAAGMVHLNAREYDPNLGRFLAVDPLMDVGDPQSWQGYAYANNTPVTANDASGMRVCLDECGGEADKYVQNVQREKKKWRQHQMKLCPRNVPREDCLGDYKPAPRGIKDSRNYKNGTKLVIYHDGTVTINGYMLPMDYPDPYALADATDSTAPNVKPDGRYGAMNDAIRGVAAGCEAMDRGCSANFHRALEQDAMTVQGDPEPMGTVGLCLGGSNGGLVNVSASVCVQIDSKGAFISATGARPPNPFDPSDYKNGSYGGGAGIGGGIQVSDARSKDSLVDQFSYYGGGGKYGGEYSWGKDGDGRDVHVAYAGRSFGTPGGSAGKNYTWVSGYGPPWTKAALCPVCQLF
ncbi:RHS repeat domain-containing protein [Paractinoplanes toevensis]|uniref:Type IV secretion protein Rhs n=1 Tax=Paractinoplanes toevensis TaxID=571911 RepID=A0A920BQN5_9ACTN|nr:RHS repeat-associated core domain-containing protein [Actinoplanes toevensis]GIM97589.1 type IV secretion protein Rhs [Actinoplanes toevensis]